MPRPNGRGCAGGSRGDDQHHCLISLIAEWLRDTLSDGSTAEDGGADDLRKGARARDARSRGMRRNTKRTLLSSQHSTTTMTGIKEAVAEVESIP